MLNNNIIYNFQKKLNGSTIEFNLENYENAVNEIEQYQKKLVLLSDDQLKNICLKIKRLINNNQEFQQYLIYSYAIAKEVIYRVFNINLFREQLIGAIALANGKVIEMNTGEGKTLTAVLPAFFIGMKNKGVHVLTFNDYLAKRDALWMKPFYNFLDLSVSYIKESMSPEERKSAYNCDITYLTAKESGFDYLRDSLCYNIKDTVHRKFNFAIIDEADSLLIDEARIPLVIAGESNSKETNIHNINNFTKRLKETQDFNFDKYARNIYLTNLGINKAETFFNCNNLYSSENSEKLHLLSNSLHAHFLLKMDIDYIIKNNQIEQVDELTGRVADKRKWPNGLQAAVESKEGLDIQDKGKVLNSISLQYFLDLYSGKCAMTATIQSSEEEIKKFYNLNIVVINPHKKCIRQDYKDVIYCTKNEKNNAIITEIKKVHKTKRPILVGTSNVSESNMLFESLRNIGISCKVLNAKNDEFEAQIISDAGNLGAVTISTNMAGRGVDIKLGGANEINRKKVISLGGLYVIGTNRHESIRIDNQLRGRAARQGEPGSSKFFISLEDDLFHRFRLKELIPPNIFTSIP